MATTNERREVRIEVVTADQGLKNLATQFGNLNKSLKSMSSSFGSMNTMFQAFIGANVLGFGLRQFAEMADSMQLLTDRLNLFTDGRGAEEMERLFQIAEKTKAPIESVAETYNRFAMSTKDLGLSSKELGDIITVLQNTFRLSGAGVQEASSATIQLSQALSLGKLQGQEFRAVMLSNATFADLLGKSLGKTRGELAKMSEAGQLTSDVVLKALRDGMTEVNTRADSLGQTFGQTLTVAMNEFTKEVGNLNKEFGLNSKFAAGVNFLIEKSGLIATGIGIISLSAIPALILKIRALSAAFMAFAASNPFTLALTGISIGIVAIFSNLDDLKTKMKSVWASIVETVASGVESISNVLEKIYSAMLSVGLKFGSEARAKDLEMWRGFVTNMRKYAEELRAPIPVEDPVDNKSGISKSLKYVFDYNKELRALNERLNDGKVSLSEYTLQFKSLEIRKQIEEMKEGKSTVQDLNKALREIRLTSLNIQFAQGALTVNEFNRQVESMKIDELNEKLETGIINLIDYNRQLVSIQSSFNFQRSLAAGASDYLQQVGTTGSQVAKAITGAFSSLEDGFMEFIKTGKQDWKSFAQGILDDINRIIIRAAVVQPLAEAALNLLPGAGTAVSTGGGAAGGAMFPGSSKASYITNQYSSSYPSVAYGKTSYEAPSVSAPVYVNVTNNTGVEVSTQESQDSSGNRVIDVLIQNKVKDGIMSGAFDKQFSQAFNMKRKG